MNRFPSCLKISDCPVGITFLFNSLVLSYAILPKQAFSVSFSGSMTNRNNGSSISLGKVGGTICLAIEGRDRTLNLARSFYCTPKSRAQALHSPQPIKKVGSRTSAVCASASRGSGG